MILETIKGRHDPVVLFEEHINVREVFTGNDGRDYLVQSVDDAVEMTVVSLNDFEYYHYARQIDDDIEGMMWEIYSPENHEVVETLDGDSSWVKVAEAIYNHDLDLGLVDDYLGEEGLDDE